MAQKGVSMDWQTNTNAWVKEISSILNEADVGGAETLGEPMDLENIAEMLQIKARTQWEMESDSKEKLRTFVKIHNYEITKHLVNNNLSKSQRSLVFKFKAAVLPLKIETGRFKGTNRELRLCDICNTDSVEE